MVEIEVFRSLPSVGRATFTIVRSSTVMIVPSTTTAPSVRISRSSRTAGCRLVVSVGCVTGPPPRLSRAASRRFPTRTCPKLEVSREWSFMERQSGLRELKKQRTRQLIADTDLGMFLERGFDAVTVAEVAREAEVD